MISLDNPVIRLAASCVGMPRAETLGAAVAIAPALAVPSAGYVTRAQFAMALNLVLLDDLLIRVPSAAAYLADCQAAGRPVQFDHGALRTIDGPSGALPAGYLAFARILEPLGYHVADIYPLDRLRMTGRAYAQRDFPEDVPQFFVSELHVSQFTPGFGAAAQRVFGTSQDPIKPIEQEALDGFTRDGAVALAVAEKALPGIARAFDRHHALPTLEDYRLLLAESAEAAWIATEGNAFNHATDRVSDVVAVAAHQRALGRAVKDKIEVSASGRVRQTAFRADHVARSFATAAGEPITQTVPGSFFEFISRDTDPATGRMDLRFDSGNATGIFAMTKAA